MISNLKIRECGVTGAYHLLERLTVVHPESIDRSKRETATILVEIDV